MNLKLEYEITMKVINPNALRTAYALSSKISSKQSTIAPVKMVKPINSNTLNHHLFLKFQMKGKFLTPK